MHHPIRVLLLDTNVLTSWVERTIYVSLTQQGVIDLKWSESIERDLIEKSLPNQGKSPDQINLIIQDLHLAVPGWQVIPNLRDLAKTSEVIEVPDRDDLEVLAAAIAADADIIVTKNLKDFSLEMIQRTGIAIEHSNDVLNAINKIFPYEMSVALSEVQAATSKSPTELLKNAGIELTR